MGVDTAARTVELDDGERMAYERLLLATGAEPRRLTFPGAELDGVHYLRTLADSDALASRLEAGGHAVVIGGGWIGAEVAASARQTGLEVSMIERERMPLERVLGSELGCFFAELHRDRGVALHTGQGVERLEGSEAVERVRLADGRVIDCDFVVVGVGVLPRTELAERAGIAVGDGVLVDERLETDAPGIFAAGDVAVGRASLLRTPAAGRALGERPAPARGRRPGDARQAGDLGPAAVLLQRPVRARDGVHGTGRRSGTESCCAATAPRASSSPSGSAAAACWRA